MNVLKSFVRVMEVFNKYVGYLLAIILAVMTLLIFWQVVSRHFFGTPLSWSEELARFLMIYLIMVGSALATKDGGMISVDILLEKFESTKFKPYIITIAQLLSIIFFVVLFIYGYQFAMNSFNQIAPGSQISMGWVYLSIPFGAVLLTINSITRIVSVFVGEEKTE
ncbi:TRAP transporter small permease [Corticicoccus populi]|uniref:TRAP transporter small permease n=1 Tax=Corticicoccus populi TaxID=1812821 RepID=A0ABW5WY16_9STAP